MPSEPKHQTPTEPVSDEPAQLGQRHRVSAEVWQTVRRMVEDDAISIADIARKTGLPETTITSKVRREGWLRKWQVAQELAGAEPEERRRLIARLYKAFEKQVTALETRLKDLTGNRESAANEMDVAAKAITSLAKTLDMLIDLQDAHGVNEQKEGSDDELRQQLSRKIASLCGAGQTS
ncbi:hypothetical protein [Pseudovibrio sp. Tun.PSC04-5.I4]|uniref:hypothetical protein n=1 Tax=Pseudovibrio sp. Tun.PSC04-5.I4 TaxID=1798213 RepID=UPI000889B3FD|nr:hypothetical protein [Pseudovibrio sp. Tun.PSC04-5.I4]SDQ88717.1 hypothetical protein SAMN04515695_1777 [Pseudovibrio sp. Tun.PSC04-5.I4]